MLAKACTPRGVLQKGPRSKRYFHWPISAQYVFVWLLGKATAKCHTNCIWAAALSYCSLYFHMSFLCHGLQANLWRYQQPRSRLPRTFGYFWDTLVARFIKGQVYAAMPTLFLLEAYCLKCWNAQSLIWITHTILKLGACKERLLQFRTVWHQCEKTVFPLLCYEWLKLKIIHLLCLGKEEIPW